MFISTYPIMLLQNLNAIEPLGVAKDYGIDLQTQLLKLQRCL